MTATADERAFLRRFYSRLDAENAGLRAEVARLTAERDAAHRRLVPLWDRACAPGVLETSEVRGLLVGPLAMLGPIPGPPAADRGRE